MHLERIRFFVSFAVLQILIDLVNIDARKEVDLRVEGAVSLTHTSIPILFGLVNIEATKSVTITVEDRFTYESTAQFDVFGVERFDNLNNQSYPKYQSNFGLGSNSPIIGTYIDLEVAPADIYGGATSNGFYPFARSGTFYGLRLDNPANFFGLWVSSADDYNIVQFFHHGEKVYEYRVKNVIEGLGGNREVYLGNPTYNDWWGYYGPSGWISRAEEYLFINAFFNGGLVYDHVHFVQEGKGCFESDNHSVGNWTQTSGRLVMTESAITLPAVASVQGV